MSHEITNEDRIVLHKQTAWHGLGLVVQEELSPTEALQLVGLDEAIIDQWTLTATSPDGQTTIEVPSHVYNVRRDNHIPMGIVSSNYVPVQNVQMAQFCEALHEVTDEVKIETLGTIQQGKRIWMLLKGQPFGVRNAQDEVVPYICVSNGHDGTASFRVTPTSVRVVCSNTLHMVIPRKETGELLSSAISIRHTVNIMQRIDEARAALKHYQERQKTFRETAERLAQVNVTREDVQKFFLESYTHDFGEVPMNPQNKVEDRRRDRAMSAWNSFSKRFDDERSIAGATAWNAFNAWSGLVQHDRKARGADDLNRVEKRRESNLFGLNQDRTQAAFGRALQMLAT